MKQFLKIACVVVASTVSLPLFADTVLLKDGTSREGKILDQSPTEIRLRINEDGMQATVVIPMSNVSSVKTGPVKAPAPMPAPPPPTSSRPATRPLAGTENPSGKTAATMAALPPGVSPLAPTHGFFAELGNALIGMGPDDPRRLPPDLLALWKTAVTLDATGKRAGELDAMRSLSQAFAASPNGLARLDGISRHERQQPFGLWMASVHWDLLADAYHSGNFDLNDIRDAERPALIGLFKEKTGPALEPLKTYFPPIDDKTGKPAAFRPTQLAGITVDTALDTKDKAELAHAILLGQIKLQPDMPPPDKQLLFTQLANVNHILTRTNELEPQAKAAQLKAERAKKLGH